MKGLVLMTFLDERGGLDDFSDEGADLTTFSDERVGLDEKERACSEPCRTEQARLYFCGSRGPVYLCHRFLFTPYRGVNSSLRKSHTNAFEHAILSAPALKNTSNPVGE